MMMNGVINQFDEVEYFTDLAKIRYGISQLMYRCEMIDAVNPSNGDLNSFYRRINKNQKAAFYLEFMNDVIPYCLYTPYGAMEINPFDENKLKLSYSYLTDEEKNGFMRMLKEKLQLKLVQPAIIDSETGIVRQPAIYAITKLPWKETDFTERSYEQACPTKMTAAELSAEKAHCAEIYQQVNARLQAAGLPEVAFSDARPEVRRVSHVKMIQPKTPRDTAELMRKNHG